MISNHYIYLNNKSIFLYAFIIIICLFLAKMIPITLSIIFFLILGFVLIYFHYEYTINVDHVDLFTEKLNRYRIYDKNRYQSLMTKLDQFNEIYNNINQDPRTNCYQNIDLAIGYARDAINILTSFNLLLIPTDSNYDILQSDITTLKQKMNNSIIQLVTQCSSKNDIFGSDITNDTYLNPKPYNEDANSYDKFIFD